MTCPNSLRPDGSDNLQSPPLRMELAFALAHGSLSRTRLEEHLARAEAASEHLLSYFDEADQAHVDWLLKWMPTGSTWLDAVELIRAQGRP